MMKLKVGDHVSCIYGKGHIHKLDPQGLHTIKMYEFTGVGYPSILMGVHETNIKLLNE